MNLAKHKKRKAKCGQEIYPGLKVDSSSRNFSLFGVHRFVTQKRGSENYYIL